MILFDTNIIVETLKNNIQAINTFQHIGAENVSVSAITAMELYFGAMDKRELMKIKKHIKLLRIIHVNPEISEKAINLIEKYAKSHTLHIADAFIAATAIHYQLELLTYNVKDFKFIENYTTIFRGIAPQNAKMQDLASMILKEATSNLKKGAVKTRTVSRSCPDVPLLKGSFLGVKWAV